MSEYKDFAVYLALKAGEIMRQNFTTGMHKEWKEDDSPVTVTDLAINSLVISEVHKKYPNHGVLSEEGSCFNSEEHVWVCDPVDGTNPFSHGYPLFTFSLALVKNGYPILGLLYDPILNRLVFAELGEGAYLNNKPIMVSDSVSFFRSLAAIESYQYQFNTMRQDLAIAGCLTTTFACISYSCMLVALGEFVAAIWCGKTPWDGAAAQIIVEEAGGVCTDIEGCHQRYDGDINGIIASNKQLHSKLIDMVRNSFNNVQS